MSSDQLHQSQLLCLKDTTGKTWPEWIAFVREEYPEHHILSLQRFQNTAQQEEALHEAGCDLSLSTGFVRYAPEYFLEEQYGATQQYGIVRGSTDSTPMRTKLVKHLTGSDPLVNSVTRSASLVNLFSSRPSFNVGASKWMLQDFCTTPTTTEAFNQLFLFKDQKVKRHYNANNVDFLHFTREEDGAREGIDGTQDHGMDASAPPPVIDPFRGQIAENETEEALLSMLIPR